MYYVILLISCYTVNIMFYCYTVCNIVSYLLYCYIKSVKKSVIVKSVVGDIHLLKTNEQGHCFLAPAKLPRSAILNIFVNKIVTVIKKIVEIRKERK